MMLSDKAVGENNPYRTVKDAWKEELQRSPIPLKNSVYSNNDIVEVESSSSSDKLVVVNESELKSQNSESDDWELLAEEKE